MGTAERAASDHLPRRNDHSLPARRMASVVPMGEKFFARSVGIDFEFTCATDGPMENSRIYSRARLSDVATTGGLVWYVPLAASGVLVSDRIADRSDW